MPLRHFDWIARHYDRLSGQRPRDFWRKHFPTPVIGRLLDVGGGTGRLSQAFVGEACSVIVVDESMEMLKQAACKPGLQVVQAHAEMLPFQSGSFQAGLMVDALHHVAQAVDTIDELVRVVEGGGIIVIEEPDIARWQVKLIALAERILLMRSRFLTGQQIAAYFSRHGGSVTTKTEMFANFISFTK